MHAATGSNAELLGLNGELGTVTKGKAADVIVVRGDLTADIKPLTDRESAGLVMPRLQDVWPR